MIKRKKSEGFNLAFLDIMSCGLGAIILVFMLVKFNVNDASIEVGKLKKDVENLEAIKQDSLQALEKVESELAEQAKKKADLKQDLAEKQTIAAKQNTDVQRASQKIEHLKSDIKDIKVPKKEDLIEIKKIHEENYLLGLKVEGPKIAILVDSSASMTHEKLIDIIKTKNGAADEKQQAEKWRRTKSIVNWLLARVPTSSDVVVVAFSEKAKVLGSPSWMKATSSSLSTVLADLEALTPEGATNLQHGLQTVNKLKPSNLYIITDGLPTKGESNYKSLNPFASCSSLSGSSTTISGECRVKLFQQTIIESTLPGVQVDVILLPIEGDPEAINQYWNWTAATGGLLISPASNWP